MTRWWILFLLIICQGWVGLAQSPTLVVPSAEDYVAQVQAIVDRADTFYYESMDSQSLAELQALYDEIEWRLLDNDKLTYEQVKPIYEGYRSRPIYITDSLKPEITLSSIWIPSILKLWLSENQVNLSEVSTLTFDNFVIDIDPLDPFQTFLLTLLDVPTLDPQEELLSYIAIGNGKEGYKLPSISVPIEDVLIAEGDFNADGQWDIAYTFYSSYGNSRATGSLWLASITPKGIDPIENIMFGHGPFTSPLTWQAQNVDSDSQIEFVQTQQLSDNWNCKFIQVNYYDWDEQQRLASNTSKDVLPNTFECLWRQAEVEVWTYRFDEALEFYETAFSKITNNTNTEAAALFNLRYATTLLLAGSEEAASVKFADDTLFTNSELAKSVQQIYLNDPRALPTCQRYFNYTANNPRPFENYLSGTVYEDKGGFWGPDSYNPGFDLENASCDLSQLLESYVTNTKFPIATNPVDQLKAEGLSIGDSLTADLNGDEQDDWLVWMNSIGVNPLLFVADGNTYNVSTFIGYQVGSLPRYTNLRSPDVYNRYEVVALPDGSIGLLNLDFSIDEYAYLNCIGCGDGGLTSCPEKDASLPRSVGDLTLWRLEEASLNKVFFAPICALPTLEQLFPQGVGTSSLMAGENISYQDAMGALVVPTTYEWDSSARTYVPPVRPTPTPSLRPTDTSYVEAPRVYQVSYYDYRELMSAFQDREFDLVLEIANQALTGENPEQTLINAFRYYRALALEATNQPEAALTEYLAIDESEPESAWGIMAALHFE